MSHRFSWDPSLDTGIEELDIQHRRFVTLINHLDATDNTDAVLAEILRHLIYHFRCEQALMDAYEEDYAAMEEEEHQQEEASVRELIQQFRDGFLEREQLCDRLYGFLVQHSGERDKPLASSVIAKRNSI